MTSSSRSPDLFRRRGGPWRIALAAGRSAASQPVLGIIVALIAAATVVVTLVTAGRTVGTQRAVLSRFDTLEVTVIQVLDDEGNTGLDASDVATVRRLTGVDWVLGIGPVVDVRVAGLRGQPVPSRVVVGSSDLIRLSDPVDGEAYVGSGSQRSLGLEAASGAVETTAGHQIPVVGSFRATGPLAEMAESVLIPDSEYAGPLRRLYVRTTSAEDIVTVAAAVAHAVGDRDGSRPRVVVADDVAAIRAVVGGELGGAGRSAVIQALAAGLVLGAITIFSGVQARRRDFGRRRALGATRAQLMSLVIAQTVFVAAPGAAVGAVIGATLAERLSGSWPGLEYPLSITILTVLTLAVAAAPPAIVAASRDPVAAIRVP